MSNRWVVFLAFAALIITLGFYFVYFGAFAESSWSEDPSDWASFGSYVGGVAGPLLSFASIVLLIQSLTLQKKSNLKLEAEILENSKKHKIEKFENKFFNLIEYQRKYFENFELTFLIEEKEKALISAEAVAELEDIILEMKRVNSISKDYNTLIEDLDYRDQIFTHIRIFNSIVTIIENEISDENNFNSKDRRSYYSILIHFTDFALIRLILITLKHYDIAIAKRLANLEELQAALVEAKLTDYFNNI